eukprot:scaffold74902_cov17-Tisochrysis_lutea.AAC.2
MSGKQDEQCQQCAGRAGAEAQRRRERKSHTSSAITPSAQLQAAYKSTRYISSGLICSGAGCLHWQGVLNMPICFYKLTCTCALGRVPPAPGI